MLLDSGACGSNTAHNPSRFRFTVTQAQSISFAFSLGHCVAPGPGWSHISRQSEQVALNGSVGFMVRGVQYLQIIAVFYLFFPPKKNMRSWSTTESICRYNGKLLHNHTLMLMKNWNANVIALHFLEVVVGPALHLLALNLRLYLGLNLRLYLAVTVPVLLSSHTAMTLCIS